MNQTVYRYRFGTEVPVEEMEATLLLALFDVESLHGESQTCLDAAHHFDADRHACVIDANTSVGKDFNRLFVGFLRREFGEDTFRVERLHEQQVSPSALGGPA